MKITRLTAENFKRLVAVDIKPDGSPLVTLGGKNGAGKSSCLDAIESALGGAKHDPGEPVKRGAKAARVVIETDDLVVTRTYPAKGNPKLEVRAKDGSVYPSPQALLDGLVGKISFDPMAFVRQEGKKPAEAKRARGETLRQLVGLDFTKEDADRQKAFEKRTLVKREIERIDGALSKLPEPPAGTPDAEVSVAELLAEAERRQSVNTENAAKRSQINTLKQQALDVQKEITRLEQELAEARARFEMLNERGKAMWSEVQGLKDEDVAEVRQRIANAEATNAAVRAKAARAKLEAEHSAAIDESEQLTQYIAQIDEVKAKAIAAAKYPIPGLAVTDDGITLDGVPFEQASSAQQLRVSAAIGLASNPKLKVLLIRDGSLLDEDSLAALANLAAEADAQLWVERVSTGSEVTVVIEDGEVAEDRTKRGDAPAAGAA